MSDQPKAKPADVAKTQAKPEPAVDAATLREMVRDGRAAIRAKAVVGLAAMVPPAPELALLLRDSDSGVVAAETIARLGVGARAIMPQIAQTLASTQPQVTDIMVGFFASLIGKANDDLVLALDVPLDLAMRTLIEACARSGKAGVGLLIDATRNENGRIRSNAVAGLGRIGKADSEASLACLTHIEAGDPVPDIRTAAKQGILAILARPPSAAVDSLPKNIPDFEERKLSSSELSE